MSIIPVGICHGVYKKWSENQGPGGECDYTAKCNGFCGFHKNQTCRYIRDGIKCPTHSEPAQKARLALDALKKHQRALKKSQNENIRLNEILRQLKEGREDPDQIKSLPLSPKRKDSGGIVKLKKKAKWNTGEIRDFNTLISENAYLKRAVSDSDRQLTNSREKQMELKYSLKQQESLNNIQLTKLREENMELKRLVQSNFPDLKRIVQDNFADLKQIVQDNFADLKQMVQDKISDVRVIKVKKEAKRKRKDLNLPLPPLSLPFPPPPPDDITVGEHIRQQVANNVALLEYTIENTIDIYNDSDEEIASQVEEYLRYYTDKAEQQTEWDAKLADESDKNIFLHLVGSGYKRKISELENKRVKQRAADATIIGPASPSSSSLPSTDSENSPLPDPGLLGDPSDDVIVDEYIRQQVARKVALLKYMIENDLYNESDEKIASQVGLFLRYHLDRAEEQMEWDAKLADESAKNTFLNLLESEFKRIIDELENKMVRQRMAAANASPPGP